MIIDFLKYKEIQEKKKAIIFGFLLGYCKEKAAGDVNIPYFLDARDMYNDMIKNNKDVNFYYKKLKTSK